MDVAPSELVLPEELDLCFFDDDEPDPDVLEPMDEPLPEEPVVSAPLLPLEPLLPIELPLEPLLSEPLVPLPIEELPPLEPKLPEPLLPLPPEPMLEPLLPEPLLPEPVLPEPVLPEPVLLDPLPPDPPPLWATAGNAIRLSALTPLNNIFDIFLIGASLRPNLMASGLLTIRAVPHVLAATVI